MRSVWAKNRTPLQAGVSQWSCNHGCVKYSEVPSTQCIASLTTALFPPGGTVSKNSFSVMEIGLVPFLGGLGHPDDANGYFRAAQGILEPPDTVRAVGRRLQFTSRSARAGFGRTVSANVLLAGGCRQKVDTRESGLVRRVVRYASATVRAPKRKPRR